MRYIWEFLIFQYWEKAEFPFHIIPKLGALRIAGGTIKVANGNFICYCYMTYISCSRFGGWVVKLVLDLLATRVMGVLVFL